MPCKSSETITNQAFAACMTAMGPFETEPHIAVGVSGGADSLALMLLLEQWVAARGGHLTALSVDHRLRPESTAEAQLVADIAKSHGISHCTLTWRGAKPKSDLQAAARDARYRLMARFCEKNAILHLAVAHHRDDLAETFMLRLARGSGLTGLAAMAPVTELPGLRLLRPLLSVPKAHLLNSLASHGVSGSEDPSNDDPSYARVRMRHIQSILEGEGLTARRLADTVLRLGRARSALDHSVANLLARSVMLHPAGFAQVNPNALLAAPDEVSMRALSRCLTTVSGGRYGQRLAKLEGLHQRLRCGLRRATTSGGCRVIPWKGTLLIVREASRAAPVTLPQQGRFQWDGRYMVALRRVPGASFRLGSLGAQGWRQGRASCPGGRSAAVPAPVRATLPALWDSFGLAQVPHLGFIRPGFTNSPLIRINFSPQRALTVADFTVASTDGHIIC